MVSANGLDRITMEAQNLARLEAGQTPLAGGDNPMVHVSDFSGVTPRQNVASTPNPLLGATPRPGETPRGGATNRITAGTLFSLAGSICHDVDCHLKLQSYWPFEVSAASEIG